MGIKSISEVASIETPINQDAIDILEQAPEDVRSGELTAVAVSWITSDRVIGGAHSSGPNNILLWAALEHSARSFYNDMVVGDE